MVPPPASRPNQPFGRSGTGRAKLRAPWGLPQRKIGGTIVLLRALIAVEKIRFNGSLSKILLELSLPHIHFVRRTNGPGGSGAGKAALSMQRVPAFVLHDATALSARAGERPGHGAR